MKGFAGTGRENRGDAGEILQKSLIEVQRRPKNAENRCLFANKAN